MRKNMVPPLNGTTDSLHIKFKGLNNYSLVDVVDSLRWISPQLNTLSFILGYMKHSILNFIYEDASTEDEKTFWSCNLKEVKMENFTCMEQQEFRNYLFTNEDNYAYKSKTVFGVSPSHSITSIHYLTDRTRVFLKFWYWFKSYCTQFISVLLYFF